MVICSAPGKILWLGGYAVLERPNVSFITGVNKRVYAQAKESYKIVFRSSQFGLNASGIFENGKIILNEDSEKAKFVKTTAEGCLQYFAWKNIPLKNFELETKSDEAFGVEVKAGLGSSAAVCVATAAALFEIHRLSLAENKEKIHKIAQWAHNTAQGKVGSGFDVAAACYGASSYVRYSPEILKQPFPQVIDSEWDYETKEIPLPKQFKVAIAALGKSASTSEMVKKINGWKAGNSNDYWLLMNEYNASNSFAIAALKKLSSDFSEKNLSEFKKMFNHSQFLRKQLGVKSGCEIESDEYTQLRLESDANGAFVSCLPGAGGGDSIAAFCLSEEDKKKLEEFWKSKGLNVLDISVSNEGVRAESFLP
jgi:phosphomevalonate kinase